MTRRLVALVFAAALASALLTLAAGRLTAHAATRPTETMLSVGDRFRVDGAPLGCRVARISSYAHRVFVDCRRAGQLRGTYGTLLSSREALVVRFRSAHTAKVVFQATQEGSGSRCR
jgi:hypothetical protein